VKDRVVPGAHGGSAKSLAHPAFRGGDREAFACEAGVAGQEDFYPV
jgi:hypothetical protein